MLASFPPPGLNSTPTTASRYQLSRWNSPFTNTDGFAQKSYTDLKTEMAPRKTGRRCCGLPLWAFTVLMMVLVVLIAAAIIVPITLIVLPRQSAQSAATAIANCQTSTPCANGGTRIASSTSCSCVCTNGFSGPTCNHSADSGCTTINLDSVAPNSSFQNATLGSSIPRLLSAANSNFSVPLNSTLLLSQFSVANLSCSAENALVNFNGKTQRRDEENPKQDAVQDINVRHATLAARFPDATGTVTYPAGPTTGGIISTDGIVLASPAATSITTTATTASVITLTTSASTTTSPSVLTNGQVPITQQDLDFARIVVLYILQESSLGAAITAQQNLQGMLIGTTFKPGIVPVGGNVTANFLLGTVILADGTTAGGSWNSTG